MNIDWTIIRRSINDSLGEEEKALLDRWLGDSPSNRAFYEEVRRFYSAEKMPDISDEKIRQYKKDFETRLAAKMTSGRSRRLRQYMRVAAAIVAPLLIGGGVIWLAGRQGWFDEPQPIMPGTMKAFVYNMDTGEQTVVTLEGEQSRDHVPGIDSVLLDETVQSAGPADSSANVARRVVIPRGAEYPLAMQDGTVVWINSSSELIYNTNPSATERRVYLKGEAYFDVSPDPLRPFIVVADDVEVRVYGTRFNVNTRSGKFIQTIVEQGSVSVRTGDEVEKMLKPSEMGQYDRTTGKIEIHRVNTDLFLSWKSGIYIFENKPIEDILTELSLWYDVEVSYPNEEARRQRFSGSLPRNRELSDLLKLIEKTTRVNFEIKDRTVIVK